MKKNEERLSKAIFQLLVFILAKRPKTWLTGEVFFGKHERFQKSSQNCMYSKKFGFVKGAVTWFFSSFSS